MYRGFNLEVAEDDYLKFYKQDISSLGSRILEEQKSTVNKEINTFCDKDGCIDASKLGADWFPEIEADIFLSHSHKDEKIAIFLAGWLYKNFELETFIDSCVWGYANKLLNEIDNRYCLNPVRKTYDYKMRNLSTSHVYMMLSTALASMIDKTECVFFLNTPKSITFDDTIKTNKTKTLSPWIYNEITMTKLIRTNKPPRIIDRDKKLFEETLAYLSDLTFRYDVDIDHLKDINFDNLKKWELEYSNKKPNVDKYDSLDILYDIWDER